MLEVTENEIKNRLVFDNPWWDAEGDRYLEAELAEKPERSYLGPFLELVTGTTVNRAVVLMGPRRVGKTIILKQSIRSLLNSGVERRNIFFTSVDNPIFVGIGLEKILRMFLEIHGHDRDARLYVIFDEVQYLKDWEVHLKVLVDSFPSMRFVVSGSAAATLKMKSNESGAGRFTDFLLPPLTFAEFCRFRDVPDDVDIDALNEQLLQYLQFGGFPEAVLSREVQQNMGRFLGRDIIDKVLLRDLPSLYGIADPQELNRFFATLAYNTGNEVSLDELSQSANVAKNTIRKYLEYLESAFLIHRLYRIDQNARHFKRATHFKVYLTNPCLRTALYGPVMEEDGKLGLLIETAVMAQFIHTAAIDNVFYARWDKGEVDFVWLDPATQKPVDALEIKWSENTEENLAADSARLMYFCKKNPVSLAPMILSKKLDMRLVSVDGVLLFTYSVARHCRDFGVEAVDGPLSKGIHPRRLLPDISPLS